MRRSHVRLTLTVDGREVTTTLGLPHRAAVALVGLGLGELVAAPPPPAPVKPAPAKPEPRAAK